MLEPRLHRQHLEQVVHRDHVRRVRRAAAAEACGRAALDGSHDAQRALLLELAPVVVQVHTVLLEHLPRGGRGDGMGWDVGMGARDPEMRSGGGILVPRDGISGRETR